MFNPRTRLQKGLEPMSYEYGTTKAAQQAQALEAEARRKAAELARLNQELDARIEARKKQLKYVPPVRSYAPTPEQLAYREQHKPATLPEPQWGGRHNLYLASLEAAQWDQTHRRGKRHDKAA
jgi:hypothetical protein